MIRDFSRLMMCRICQSKDRTELIALALKGFKNLLRILRRFDLAELPTVEAERDGV